MHDARQKFEPLEQLLREIFQFDLADLDFGLYRIMNHKRQVIDRWIKHDLPKAIEEELRQGALAKQQQAQQALAEARQKVLQTLGKDALDAEGNLAEQYRETPLGKAYLEARQKAAHAQPAEALEAQVYNHLCTFFSRYYQDGDFISKRRYSRKERYAIPYNGEEVYLYWVNHDQYYVKTAEHFTDYTYKAPNGVTVHFKLQAADVEVNNVKGEKRFFLPVLNGMAWDAETRTLTIPFHYRPLTEHEKITYAEKQEKILEEALEAIPARLKGNPVSYLEHHLRQYTARNTRDFFIHKGLKGFLSRELDFYLKNEVLNLDELEAAGEDLAEGWFQLMRLIKRIGGHIIDFLAQIEDFQKALWEKKKFITETFYCITVGHIPEDFYPEIAANEEQWNEWRSLGLTPGHGHVDVSSAHIPPNADVPSAQDTPSGNPSVPPASKHKGWHSRGYLPHFDAGGVFQFVTFRLHDSVPASVIERWKQELRWREGLNADSQETVELRKRIENYADQGKGACYLRDERIAKLVEEALHHWDGQHYHLVAWCIMPNHVHVLIRVLNESLSKIVQSWKSYTAHQANKLLGRTGQFWAQDYFDRYIRDEKHFEATVAYILQNPVKAGLVNVSEEWPWCGYAGGAEAPLTGGEQYVQASGGGGSGRDGGRRNSGGRDVRDPGNPRITDRIAFLKDHPTLVLDTRHFPPDFTDRLLASFENLDEMTDGLLVHSENWQALNLLLEKYRERVKTIYIDPPYNTGNDEFLYRDNYQHSSWLAMMADRLGLAREWMREDGVIFVSIDENEQPRLRLCGDEIFGESNYVTDVIWNARKSVSSDTLISLAHHHTLFWARNKALVDANKHTFRLPAEKSKFANPDNDPKGPWTLDPFDAPNIRPNLTYEIVNPITGERFLPPPGRHWRVPKDEFERLLAEGRIVFGKSGKGKPMLKRYWSEAKAKGKAPTTLWTDLPTTTDGTKILQSMFPTEMKAYLDQVKPKPPGLIERIVSLSSINGQELVLDYFAGSGTTGHAVINLNREDGGRRKFILVEMGEYFDTVLLPRIKKVTFTPEWKDGKPKRSATQEEFERGPRIVKVIRLESYEDALNNITFDEESGQKALDLFGEEYLLRYMLKWEARRAKPCWMWRSCKARFPTNCASTAMAKPASSPWTCLKLSTTCWAWTWRPARSSTPPLGTQSSRLHETSAILAIPGKNTWSTAAPPATGAGWPSSGERQRTGPKRTTSATPGSWRNVA